MLAQLLQTRWQAAAILLLAAALRLWALDLRPPHFDEGVNGWFADQMTRTGYYRYDPTNYHGPLHFYAVFVSQTLLGRNLWALRLPAVLASLLAVWAVLQFARFFGSAARLAALGMAVSPAAVYYGRYSIHESWMAFFVLAALLGVLGLWQRGSVRDLAWLAVGISGMVLSKETYVIHLGAMVLAVPCLLLWQRVVPSSPSQPPAPQSWTARDAGVAAGLGALAVAAFYSGLFLDFQALSGLWETFATWTRTGVEAGGHDKPAYDLAGPLNVYWLVLMLRYEPLALAGFAFCFVLLAPAEARLRYLAIYGAGVLLAYSLIPYKTPWCILVILPPFYLLGAAGIGRLPKVPAALALAGLLGWTTFASVRLNFFRHSSDEEMYCYVQSYEGVRTACAPLLEKARRDPRFAHAPGVIALESYYPLPWLLGDFTRVAYHPPENLPGRLDAAFVLGRGEDAAEIERRLAGGYLRRGFDLRSGVVNCVAYYREEEFADVLEGRAEKVTGGGGGGDAPAPASPAEQEAP